VHVPHCVVICGLSDSGMLFPHYLIKDKVFGKKFLNTKCVFWCSLQPLYERLSFCEAFNDTLS